MNSVNGSLELSGSSGVYWATYSGINTGYAENYVMDSERRSRRLTGNRTKFVCKLDGAKDSFSEMFTGLSGREEVTSNAENGDVVNGMH